MKTRSQVTFITIVMALVGLVIYRFSMSIDWVLDNFTYQFSFATHERIKSVSEIFPSMNVHYMTWNGRYVAHWLVQFFVALFGRTAFSVCNAIVYIIYILLLTKLGKGKIDNFKMVLTSTILALFYTDVVYEPTCQIGYIWMPALSMAFILLFFKNWEKQPGLPLMALLFVFSIISGNGHDVINVGIGGALIIYFLFNLRRIQPVQWVLAVGFAIGGLALCLAPSNFIRASKLEIPLVYSLLTVAMSLRMTYVFLVVLIYKLLTHQLTLKDFYRENSFYVNCAVILTIMNFALGTYVYRQFMGVEICCAILTLRILKNHSFGWRTLAVGIVAVIVIYVYKYSEIEKSRRVYGEITDAVHSTQTDTIYVDIPLFTKYMNPAPTIRYGNYFECVPEQVLKTDADCVETPDRVIKTYPVEFRVVSKFPVKNRYIMTNPGEYLLLQDKNHPGKFILHRRISLFGLGVDLPPYEVTFDTSNYLNTDSYNVSIIPIIFPFIDNIGIEIIDVPAE